jgi:hypothetical protein
MGVVQTWHELDCAITLEAARGAALARGVAKAQMISALLAARAKLPAPLASADDDEYAIVRSERVEQWRRRHTADVSDAKIA